MLADGAKPQQRVGRDEAQQRRRAQHFCNPPANVPPQIEKPSISAGEAVRCDCFAVVRHC
jgi:hypothetical protein